MKAVILAGGMGTRLSEETQVRPKPMVEIGNEPILLHIMRIFSMHGINEFILCLGYKGYLVKEFFANYYLHRSDVTFDLRENRMEIHKAEAEAWRVTLVDTGRDTMTGGRIKRILSYVGGEEFCLTYGDGVADIDITQLVDFHRSSNVQATVTGVQPLGRFGSLELAGDRVKSFKEKEPGGGGWINGGFFVLNPDVGSYIAGDQTVWEAEPLERLAQQGQLACYRHLGFWHAMDTMRDKVLLDELCAQGDPPWSHPFGGHDSAPSAREQHRE